MKPDPTLPPWSAQDQRDRLMMHDWVNARLDELDAEERRRQADPFPPIIPPEYAEKYDKWRREGGLELLAMAHGVIGPMRDWIRSRFPTLPVDDIVQLPPLGRGDKYPRTGGVSITDKRPIGIAEHKAYVAAAAEGVKRIREIWRTPPPGGFGKKNRHPTDGPSAAELAVERINRHRFETYQRGLEEEIARITAIMPTAGRDRYNQLAAHLATVRTALKGGEAQFWGETDDDERKMRKKVSLEEVELYRKRFSPAK